MGRRVLIGAALALLVACSKTESRYSVNLSPAWKTGQKFQYAGDYTATTRAKRVITGSKVVAEESVEQKQARTLHLEAEGEALEIFPDGQVKKIALTVRSLEGKTDEKALAGLPTRGTKIIIEKSSDGQRNVSFETGDSGWSPPNGDFGLDVLNPVLWIEDSKFSMQEEFGPSAPVASGETWTGNMAAILDDARSVYGQVSGAKVAMKLDSVEGTDKNQRFNVSGEIVLDGVKSPLPAGFSGPVTYSSKLLLVLPPATTAGVLAKKQTVDMNIRGEMADPATGLKVSITIDAERVEDHKITFH